MVNISHGGCINKKGVIDFSASINPLGLSAAARKGVLQNISRIMHYPEADSGSLKDILSAFHGVDRDNLAIGNGSIELIYLLPRALAAKRVLIITPTFSEYEFACKSHGIDVVFLSTEEKDDFRIDPDRIKKYLNRVDLVFLGNPNNPTGQGLSRDELSALVNLCARYGTILVTDEAFIDFVADSQRDSFVPKVCQGKTHIIIRSMTKFFAMPGLRLGYVMANSGFIKKITELQYPWNVNSLAQTLASMVLKDTGYADKTRARIRKERDFLFKELGKINGLKLFPSVSNFILCKLENSGIKNAKILNEKLVKKGIFVRDCSNFMGLDERFFRMAVRNRDENVRLINAMKGILAK